MNGNTNFDSQGVRTYGKRDGNNFLLIGGVILVIAFMAFLFVSNNSSEQKISDQNAQTELTARLTNLENRTTALEETPTVKSGSGSATTGGGVSTATLNETLVKYYLKKDTYNQSEIDEFLNDFDLYLLLTDQRYNETSWVLLQNYLTNSSLINYRTLDNNTFTNNVNVTSHNITDVQCIKYISGGMDCST